MDIQYCKLETSNIYAGRLGYYRHIRKIQLPEILYTIIKSFIWMLSEW